MKKTFKNYIFSRQIILVSAVFLICFVFTTYLHTSLAKKEALVQGDIEKQENANALTNKVTIEKTADGVKIQFPADFDYSKINGKVSLYRPSSQKLDFEIPISLSSPHLLIPKSNLAGGLWDISIDWEYDGVKYLNKNSFRID